MAEFGENLKRIREEKGITQQTLADQLYVTRQAISRWEGGSRYPDLMTAKKMAQYLGVSLDELVSDDDMQLYVEKNAILDSSVPKRVQLVLMTLAFMCTLVSTIVLLGYYIIQDGYIIKTFGEPLKSILLMGVLGYGIYGAIEDKLNSRMATILCALYFGTALLSSGLMAVQKMIVPIFTGPITFNMDGVSWSVILVSAAVNMVILVIYILFFGRRITSPVLIYIMTGIYACEGICNYLWNFTGEFLIEFTRDTFYTLTFSLLEHLLVLGLLAFMAHTLHKKRKLAAK